MALQECGNGHLYDTDQYPRCPYCTGGAKVINFGQTPDSAIGSTVAASNPFGGGGGAAIGSTIAPQSYMQQNRSQAAADTGKTVGVFKKSMSTEPIAGWLVCIDGPERGKDYRVLAKNNSIGRSEKMDICLKSDNMVSRENHARIGYDQKHNVFHFIPGESSNTVYVNNQPVYSPIILRRKDFIEIGECKLVFIPFCDESFKWNTDVK